MSQIIGFIQNIPRIRGTPLPPSVSKEWKFRKFLKKKQEIFKTTNDFHDFNYHFLNFFEEFKVCKSNIYDFSYIFHTMCRQWPPNRAEGQNEFVHVLKKKKNNTNPNYIIDYNYNFFQIAACHNHLESSKSFQQAHKLTKYVMKNFPYIIKFVKVWYFVLI